MRQRTRLRNVLAQAVKPRRFVVMLKKVRRRLQRRQGLSAEDNLAWIKSHCTDFRELALHLDPALWNEAEEAAAAIETNANRILDTIEHDLGGGGAYPFLYFITRLRQPDCIVETGVAAGYSSCSFLAALEANDKGRLYSSDFPYFRLPNPEQYIGIVVDESLKHRWQLFTDGDDKNLPRILRSAHQIDLFHYDSDKTYAGRASAMATVERALSKNAIVVMDDIQDNSFFHDYVKRTGATSWYVFAFEGKYVGMVGDLSVARG